MTNFIPISAIDELNKRIKDTQFVALENAQRVWVSCGGDLDQCQKSQEMARLNGRAEAYRDVAEWIDEIKAHLQSKNDGAKNGDNGET